ncbi:alpha-L-rhamnosidase [Lactobacillus sp. ESL0681]|uniref:alpha-L-rhamnosidase n=1 Tax=Lactobacillus sp. ESL0681 TaxID=2983211 RepID=UPI0023F70718|nr:alpha-L-rhamnosidase [Lactobacillus sp. ESL0681]WEV40861.1 family 78 glycoside hydrolase catalytic domain [Lactobacillus sp. ESL0681]
MKITNILINQMVEPIGFDLGDSIRIEFSVQTKADFADVQKRLTITGSELDFDSNWREYDNNVFDEHVPLLPRTRYTVRVQLRNQKQQTEQTSFFETGKMTEPYTAEWIGNPNQDLQNTLLRKEFALPQKVKTARLYITGLGLYEAYLNKRKIGTEFLSPGVTAYDKLVQVQTYDVSQMFTDQQQQELVISLADGWYKGNFGFEGGQENIYGNRQIALAELHLEFIDSSQMVIKTDNTWQTTSGKVTKSAIYYGEDYDDTIKVTNWQPAELVNHPTNILRDRLSLPIKIKEQLPVQQIIQTPNGETVLDFGQNHAGWPEFYNQEKLGNTIKLEMGELLQDGNFYRDNLREARAAFEYTSDGQNKWIRPHFTYYGYRYIRVSGFKQQINAANFHSCVLYSDLKTIGKIETENSKVNRLLQNVLWGQKSNFVDVPTDCPQRDERLGWSGDADIFSETALLNMNSYPFFKKYANDMLIEQKQHHGMLTMYAPAMGNEEGGAAIWGDAATIIPWNAYQATGDPAILRQNFQGMQAWVDWISQNTTTPNLWTGRFQFGDWLALDGENPALPTGKTDEDFIASTYYYYSSTIVAKTATVLGKDKDAQKYTKQANAIKQAIKNEYITNNGRLALDTQTGYALALYFDLVPPSQKERVVSDLVSRLAKDQNHLKTGFVGTPLICQVLSDNGHHELAMQLFLNEDFPSWLYAVNLGATTIWERWDSILADGTINPEGMNSLNHYSVGAIMSWVYQHILGLKHLDSGYQEVLFAPQFDYRLKQVNGHYESSYGDLKLAYQLETDEQHTIKLAITVPFGQVVHVSLPRSSGTKIFVNGQFADQPLTLTNGKFSISYQPNKSYIEYYQLETPVKIIMADQFLVKQLQKVNPVFDFLSADDNLQNFGALSLTKLNETLPFVNISNSELNQIEKILRKTPLASERKFLNERRTI